MWDALTVKRGTNLAGVLAFIFIERVLCDENIFFITLAGWCPSLQGFLCGTLVKSRVVFLAADETKDTRRVHELFMLQ